MALALLRITIGWHFLYEGVVKIRKPGWSAAGFLLQARGPAADIYHWMAENPDFLNVINEWNKWGLTLIGLGLMVGCLTRLTGSAGIILLMLYYLCNPPFVGYFYSLPAEGSYLIVNKNLVEATALLVVVVTRAGRFFGLDLILSGRSRRSDSNKQQAIAAVGE